MRETEDCFDLANFFDEDNQDQIKVYKVLISYFSHQLLYDAHAKNNDIFLIIVFIETNAVD